MSKAKLRELLMLSDAHQAWKRKGICGKSRARKILKGHFGVPQSLEGFEDQGMSAVWSIDAPNSKELMVVGAEKAVELNLEELTNVTTKHGLGGR